MNKPTEAGLPAGLTVDIDGGRAIGRALIENGVTDLFGVHGYINPAIEEACRLGANMYHFRHEQSGGFAADAYARAMRRPGVFFASASGGMSNCLAPLSQGIGALSPMVLLIGQHGTAGDDIELLQEGYAAECFKTVAKWTHRVVDKEMNAYWVRKALMDCMAYPPGPVVLEFPLNNIWDKGPEPQRKYLPGPMPTPPRSQAAPDDVSKAVERILAAERPVMICGDGVYWSDGMDEYQALVELLQIPVGSRRTARGAVSEQHPLAFSSAHRGSMLGKADLVVLVGVHAGELEAWFEPPDWPRDVSYIQINETADEIWPALPSEVTLAGNSKLVLQQLLAGVRAADLSALDRTDWLAQLGEVKADTAAKRAKISADYRALEGLHTNTMVEAISETMDPDATIIYDSYSASLYWTDALEIRFAGQVLDAGPRVALGQGVGMCIGAAVARPDSQIITVIGDGGLGISGWDIETMVRYEMPITVVMHNNSSWGGASLSQHLYHPHMDSWDTGKEIRYDKMFAELGCHTEFVTEEAELVPALQRAFASGKTAFVNVIADSSNNAMSAAWLRVKTGDIWARGINDLPPEAMHVYHGLSDREALRLHKLVVDNGLNIPMSFIAELCDRPLSQLAAAAERSSYRY
ncbi:MAG: thiamine pyrophosphate-binding protein [Gammaproteobacteria bacterium]|nr:thiamine pyrophosphate-binding protein [Gammaproteobacteria bacterium]